MPTFSLFISQRSGFGSGRVGSPASRRTGGQYVESNQPHIFVVFFKVCPLRRLQDVRAVNRSSSSLTHHYHSCDVDACWQSDSQSRRVGG